MDPLKFEILAKTLGANLNYSEKKIQIESLKAKISLKSLINKKPSLTNLNISTKSIKIKNLISFLRLILKDPKLYLYEHFVKTGYLISEIYIEFDEEGNIKNNYEIKGFVKDGKINLFNRFDLSKMDFNFQLNEDLVTLNDLKLTLNENNIFIPNITGKKEKNKFLISGKIENKKFTLSNDNLNNLNDLEIFDFKIKKVNFASENDFIFQIDDKFKIKNLKINSNIDLDKLILPNKFELNNIFPKLKKEIKLEKHQIKLSYESDNLTVEGFGQILLQKKDDKIQYKIIKNNKEINFETKFNTINNPLKLNLLNYQKKPDTDLVINIKGKKFSNENFFFKKINLLEEKNNISINNLSLTKDNKIKEFDLINLNYLDKQNLKNKIKIFKKNEYYILNGDSLNLKSVIDDILKSKNNNKKNFFKNDFKLKINIKNAFIEKKDKVIKLKGHLYFKKNELVDAKLNSVFSNQKKISFSVKSKNNEKITTLFSEYPKPLVQKYDFINGFEKGILDFYSIKKDGISNSVLIIDNFKLKEVPVLAKILTLASLQGIADLLTGEGIRFTDFEMKFKNNKELMTIEEMYAIGPAISILLEGYIESNQLISLRGTLVPATTINRSIASIPLIGDILVGKKIGEGVFGVSFKIKGPPNNLETTVNPIKTLTPRFITRTLEKIKKN